MFGNYGGSCNLVLAFSPSCLSLTLKLQAKSAPEMFMDRGLAWPSWPVQMHDCCFFHLICVDKIIFHFIYSACFVFIVISDFAVSLVLFFSSLKQSFFNYVLCCTSTFTFTSFLLLLGCCSAVFCKGGGKTLQRQQSIPNYLHSFTTHLIFLQ